MWETRISFSHEGEFLEGCISIHDKGGELGDRIIYRMGLAYPKNEEDLPGLKQEIREMLARKFDDFALEVLTISETTR